MSLENPHGTTDKPLRTTVHLLRFSHTQAGSVIVFVALSITVLILFLALAADSSANPLIPRFAESRHSAHLGVSAYNGGAP